MNINENKVEIIKPSKKLFALYEKFHDKIKNTLPDAKVELIGSLAVPMIGKKEIDILVVTDNVEGAQAKLDEVGLRKGPFIDGVGYCRTRKEFAIVEIHAVNPGHRKIELARNLIKKLKDDERLRKRFEALKVSLKGEEVEEYRRQKYEFMKENDLI